MTAALSHVSRLHGTCENGQLQYPVAESSEHLTTLTGQTAKRERTNHHEALKRIDDKWVRARVVDNNLLLLDYSQCL